MNDEREFIHYHPGLLTLEEDVGYADDKSALDRFVELSKDPKILAFQQFMKSAPLGIGYSGETDGLPSPELFNALHSLESKLHSILNTNISIVSGDKIIGSVSDVKSLVDKAKTVVPKPSFNNSPEAPKSDSDLPPFDPEADDSKPTEIKLEPDQMIRSFQEFFSKSNPIIGKLYSGPIDGQMNDALKTAASQAETIIAKEIKNDGVHGMIVNTATGKLNTDVSDVQEAINHIQQFKSTQKTVQSSTSQKRIFKYLDLIDKI